MAGSEAKLRNRRTEMKNRKRKQKSAEEPLPSPKKHRISVEVEEEEASKSQQLKLSPDFDEGFPWRNLELILSIQNKDLHLQKSAFPFSHPRL